MLLKIEGSAPPCVKFLLSYATSLGVCSELVYRMGLLTYTESAAENQMEEEEGKLEDGTLDRGARGRG